MTLEDVLQAFRQVDGEPVLHEHHGGRLYSNSWLTGGVQQNATGGAFYPLDGITFNGAGGAFVSATGGATFSVAPVSCILKNFFVRLAISSSSTNETFIVVVQGAQTSLSANIGASSLTAQSSSDVSINVNKGDRISVHYADASAGVYDRYAWSCEVLVR